MGERGEAISLFFSLLGAQNESKRYTIVLPLLISSYLEFSNWLLMSFEQLTLWTGTAYLGTPLPM